MRLLRGFQSSLAAVNFGALFVTLFPVLMIPVLFPKMHHLTGIINRFWARCWFHLSFIPFEAEYRFDPRTNHTLIFCPNHFSYLDIPTMGLNHHNTIFVGKSAMEKIPLFGYMYKKLHITVDRSRLKSKYSSLVKSLEAIDEGKSLVIFPEGGILSDNPPHMGKFKDGAFRAAIEKQIPIIPVTIPHNWIILPEYTLRLRVGKVKVIFHEPIETTGLTLEDMRLLKEKVYQVIDKELKKHNGSR